MCHLVFGLKAVIGAVASSSTLDRVGFFSNADNILLDGSITKRNTSTIDLWTLGLKECSLTLSYM